MDERMLKNKRKKTWRCDDGLKTTRDRKVITCSWIMFWNTEFTYGSISWRLEQEDTIQGYQTSEVYTEPQASQNEKEMLKEQVEEPKIHVEDCQAVKNRGALQPEEEEEKREELQTLSLLKQTLPDKSLLDFVGHIFEKKKLIKELKHQDGGPKTPRHFQEQFSSREMARHTDCFKKDDSHQKGQGILVTSL
ncbi:hypothetical protein GQ457_01G029350 [Hibiscus cannabinus]